MSPFNLQSPLSLSKLDYIIFHWEQHVLIHPQVRTRFRLNVDASAPHGASILFTSVDRTERTRPAFFPEHDAQASDFFYIDENRNLVFFSNVLLGVFYLLSGAQEYGTAHVDKLGRFPFDRSVQAQGGFIGKPLVNYYFDRMTEGLEQFCALHQLPVARKHRFSTFALFLSHDIDRVDFYSWNTLVYTAKELLGVEPSRVPAKALRQTLGSTLAQLSGLRRKPDPFWNFDYLRTIERHYGFRSTFFFLDQGVKHADAYHRFEEKRMMHLFQFLKAEQCEIAMHGASASKESLEIMGRNKARLEKASGVTVVGNRQHRLLWSHPKTALLEQRLGLRYDATLGFAAHEGFRNSYCCPFKPFDFENDRMLDLWIFPLNIMDVTLFAYRRLTPPEAMVAVRSVLEEVKKFGGVLSLLWHNSFFDERAFPGITRFYEGLLAAMAEEAPTVVTGAELLDRLEQ